MRYEISKVMINDGPSWVVIAFDGDRALGGDRHWLRREFAVEAKRLYEAGLAQHGEINRITI